MSGHFLPGANRPSLVVMTMGLGAQWAALAAGEEAQPALSGWDALGLSGGAAQRRVDACIGVSVPGLRVSLPPMASPQAAMDAGAVAQQLMQIHQLAQLVRSMSSMQSPLFGLQPGQTALAPLASAPPGASVALHQQSPHPHLLQSLLWAQPPVAALGDQQTLAPASSPTWPSNGGLPALLEVGSVRAHLPAAASGLATNRASCVHACSPLSRLQLLTLRTPCVQARSWGRLRGQPRREPGRRVQRNGASPARPGHKTHLEHQPSWSVPAAPPLGGITRRPRRLGARGAALVIRKPRMRKSASRTCHARAPHVSGSSGCVLCVCVCALVFVAVCLCGWMGLYSLSVFAYSRVSVVSTYVRVRKDKTVTKTRISTRRDVTVVSARAEFPFDLLEWPIVFLKTIIVSTKQDVTVCVCVCVCVLSVSARAAICILSQPYKYI